MNEFTVIIIIYPNNPKIPVSLPSRTICSRKNWGLQPLLQRPCARRDMLADLEREWVEARLGRAWQ